MMKIPCEIDWGDYLSDEDAVYSHKIFFGKSLAQAQCRFEMHVLEACDELRFMPAVPFRYYILAFRNHIISADLLSSYSAADAASSFLRLVAQKVAESPEMIRPVLLELMPSIEYVAVNQKLFDANPDIYGDFLQIFEDIKQMKIYA